MPQRQAYHQALLPLVEAALHSPGLLPPNEFQLARYSLNAQTRNRLLDPDICALEDYLIDHSGLPATPFDFALLGAFGDVVRGFCHDEGVSLQVGYQYMGWLLAWLNIHHPPSFFGEDPDSPLQILQIAAAVGMGEWAAAYNQIEGGLEHLLHVANSPLWRVRQSGALGLYRLLRAAWGRTMRRCHYHAMIANAREWQMLISATTPDLLIAQHRVLDVLGLLNSALRFVGETETADLDALGDLNTVLHSALAAVVGVAPSLGFAQLGVWARWDYPEVKQIVRANLAQLGDFPAQVAQLEQQLGSD